MNILMEVCFILYHGRLNSLDENHRITTYFVFYFVFARQYYLCYLLIRNYVHAHCRQSSLALITIKVKFITSVLPNNKTKSISNHLIVF